MTRGPIVNVHEALGTKNGMTVAVVIGSAILSLVGTLFFVEYLQKIPDNQNRIARLEASSQLVLSDIQRINRDVEIIQADIKTMLGHRPAILYDVASGRPVGVVNWVGDNGADAGVYGDSISSGGAFPVLRIHPIEAERPADISTGGSCFNHDNVDHLLRVSRDH